MPGKLKIGVKTSPAKDAGCYDGTLWIDGGPTITTEEGSAINIKNANSGDVLKWVNQQIEEIKQRYGVVDYDLDLGHCDAFPHDAIDVPHGPEGKHYPGDPRLS
jgi:hypothetical protein